MIGYYQKFIPDFAAISVPLTYTTKNEQPTELKWGKSDWHVVRPLLVTSSFRYLVLEIPFCIVISLSSSKTPPCNCSRRSRTSLSFQASRSANMSLLVSPGWHDHASGVSLSQAVDICPFRHEMMVHIRAGRTWRYCSYWSELRPKWWIWKAIKCTAEVVVWSPLFLTPYISSPSHYLLFTTHAHTIATCFAVVPRFCHLNLLFLSTLYSELFLLTSHHTSILHFSSLPCKVSPYLDLDVAWCGEWDPLRDGFFR